MKKIIVIGVVICLMLNACIAQTKKNNTKKNKNMNENVKLELATFGAGCFWCVEAVFQRLEGVEKVESGYAGGKTERPTYKEICTGLTGHAEVCQISYNPQKISFEELLEVFWGTHDATTINQQGNDIGTQYRSAVFYHNQNQKNLAEAYKEKITKEKVFDAPVITEITAYNNYYPAEQYHQNYYNQNSSQGYCSYTIAPKIEKLKKVFKNKLKKEGE
ncbi:MAG: peptide-methionine (S)-S-oxide reductase [Cytophagia bacterium]|nr:MAG: peptide-methionine (S)-S-oxide reductase [Cytophagia bacterium]TAG40465.1 MAG: peptide-methionine (S)-S-oxide reductase [Cytophagia bacterium]TAH29735.1 MAG: peptide-methionine (S)-S-oxide reductase [Cytophagales bacterium]